MIRKKYKMTKINQRLKNTILFCVLLIFASCVTKKDKSKCHLETIGVVSDIFLRTEIGDDGSDFGYWYYALVSCQCFKVANNYYLCVKNGNDKISSYINPRRAY